MRIEPLPIAFVMPRFEPGGTERQMIELMRRLDPARWTLHVACFEKSGGWLGRVTEAAASVETFPVTSFRTPDIARHATAFARWCRARRLAVVHTTELYSNVFALPAAALAGVPVRIGNRREINPDKTLGQIALQRASYSCAHKVVANSRAAASRLRDECVPARKIAVVANGLAFPDTGERVYRQPARRVLTVANLRQEKGHDVLLEAGRRLLQRFPDARFDVVGDGPERRALLSRAEALGVARAFSFHGHCEDVAARLMEADVFVLPSRSDACPNALIEAMAAALPVVASDVGGIPELIDHGRTGLLVPAGDPQRLADAIGRVMTEAPLAARLGQAARTLTHVKHSFDRMVGDFEAIYLGELKRRGVISTPSTLQLAAS